MGCNFHCPPAGSAAPHRGAARLKAARGRCCTGERFASGPPGGAVAPGSGSPPGRQGSLLHREWFASGPPGGAVSPLRFVAEPVFGRWRIQRCLKLSLLAVLSLKSPQRNSPGERGEPATAIKVRKNTVKLVSK